MSERPGLDRLDVRSLRDRVVNAIRVGIIQGSLRPGQKIPEQELATQLGVSRTPIREAIRILEQQGLVESRPKNGTYIAEVDFRDVVNGLLVRTSLEQLAVTQILDAMEPAAWEELCDQLDSIVDRMDEAVGRGDPVAAAEHDIKFHTTLIEATENRYLSQTWALVGLPFLIWTPERDMYPQTPADWAEGFTRRHQELVGALRSRDREVCTSAIAAHISLKVHDLDLHRVEYEQQDTRHGEKGMEES
ncbi:MAG: GntR family transcriptional regulator [Acidimicrobiia bacterium]